MRRVSQLVMVGRGTGRGLAWNRPACLGYVEGHGSEHLFKLIEIGKEYGLKDMEANKEPIPEPLSLRKFSGNFVVRTTPEMHRQLAILSAEAEVSLNRYVNSRLL